MREVFRGRRRLLVLVVAGLACLLGAAGVTAYVLLSKEPGDVSNPEVAFEEAQPEPEPEEQKPKVDRSDKFHWPQYGFTKDHRRSMQPRRPVKGPFRTIWRHRAPALLEFPPAIYRKAIYQLAGNGVLYSLRKNTGRLRWRRKLGTLAASAPAVSGGSVYVTLLEGRKGSRQGRIVALKIRGGKIRWSRRLDARTESSPLLHRGRLYVGTEDGWMLGLNAHNGRTVWRYKANGAVKASPTLANGVLYFGDYGGYVHAVRRADGRPVWKAGVASRALKGGRFYATAAVAFGRVYVGSTDGRQYSLSTRDGRLAWARQTGGYVYSSAAVDNVRGLGPTVYFGSYDTNFYALDARSGRTRWKHPSGGRISGSPTIIGDTVYYSDLGRHSTFGLSTRTGKVVFRRGYGAFDPAISDGRHLFITGRSSLTALLPKDDPEGRKRARAARRRAERREQRAKERKRKARKRAGPGGKRGKARRKRGRGRS